MVAIPVKRNKVRDLLKLELQNLVVSHFNRTVCQSIEIRRKKGPGVAANRIEAGRDPGPSGIRDDLEVNGMVGKAIDIHEDTGSVNVCVAVIQETRPDRPFERIDTVLHKHPGFLLRIHAPNVLVCLFPGQLFARFLRGGEIANVARKLPDHIRARRPHGHDKVQVFPHNTGNRHGNLEVVGPGLAHAYLDINRGRFCRGHYGHRDQRGKGAAG